MTVRFFGFALLAVAALASCDVIPYRDAKEIRVINVDTNQTEEVAKKVILLEDYTGHTCGNCPSAAREAKRLEALYPGRVVVMGVHVGYYAKPKNYSNGSYRVDYRTPAGDALDAKFGCSTSGLPKGLVNRGRFGKSAVDVMGATEWEARIAQILAEEPIGIKLDVTPTFSSSNRNLSVKVDTKFQKDYAESLKMAVYLIEDSIVSWQKEYDTNFSPVEDVQNYTHMHVLRSDLLPATGSDVITSAAAATGTSLTSTWTTTIASNIKEKHCKVIAVLYRADNDEVIQTEEVHLPKN